MALPPASQAVRSRRGGRPSPLLLLLLGLLAAAATARRLTSGGSSSSSSTGSGGGFGTGNAFAPPSPGGRRRGQGAFQSPWVPMPLRRQLHQHQHQQQRASGRRTVTMSDSSGGKAGGLLKNLQGLFRPGLAGAKPAKAVRLPTIQELHHALAAPEPGALMQLMEVRLVWFSGRWVGGRVGSVASFYYGGRGAATSPSYAPNPPPTNKNQQTPTSHPTQQPQTELPEHPGLRKGVLPNGLRYAILRNAAPPGRFDAFLEIFAGSADELEAQQGMAHIVEHISYMGSRKRCVMGWWVWDVGGGV